LLEAESAEAIEITWAARALTFIDELDRADRLLDEMVADARERGSVMGYATASAWRADVALRRGLIAAAEADGRAAIELATAHGLHFIAPHAHSFLGEALIEQGELEQAAELLERANLGPMRGSRPEIRFLHTRARARLARGDNQAAIADLRTCQAQESWFRNPNVLAWRSTLALALPPSSHSEALALIDVQLKQGRSIGQPRAIGVALRVSGLLSRGNQQISLLRQAISALEACPSTLEQAHALTELGAALRRASQRSEARQTLARALDLAAGCGARALANRAREELVTAGAAAPRAPQRRRSAHRQRTARGPHGRGRDDQPRDRADTIRHHQDGRAAPDPRLRKARHRRPDTAPSRTRRNPTANIGPVDPAAPWVDQRLCRTLDWPRHDSNLRANDYEGVIRGRDARDYGRLGQVGRGSMGSYLTDSGHGWGHDLADAGLLLRRLREEP
jgi:tetratricopeptide (TPR) repeat protein